MIKVRITTFARPDEELRIRLLKRYNNGDRFWGDLEFVSGEDYDVLIVFTYPYKDLLEKGYDERKTITIKTEPSLSSFSISHPTSLVVDQFIPLPFLPNAIKGSRRYGGNGQRIYKSKLFSSVTSELGGLPGHQSRLNFLYNLSHYLKDDIDVYGWQVDGNYFKMLHKYNGFLEDKYEGLWQYLYHFASENSFEKDYFTEKILDPIITETLCFYDGCPNVFEYIDERALIKIDANNLQASLESIVKSIVDQEYDKRVKFIRLEKKRILEDFHPFKFISHVVKEKDLNKLLKIS